MSVVANRRSVMSCFSSPVDPECHRARIVLAEKDITVEIHDVDTNNLPEDLLDLNPYATVPTMVDRDLVLYNARVLIEYLDERFPHPPLMPVDPVARASNRLYRYRIQRDIYDLVEKIDRGGSDIESCRKALRDNLTAIAPIFAQRPFFMSDDYTLVDIYLTPILWRLGHYKIKLPASAKPLLQFADRIFARDAFEASLTEGEREMSER